MPKEKKYSHEVKPKELGKRIAQVADKIGGKRKLAQKSGVKEPQIYRYISGVNLPTVNVLFSLAKAGDVSLDWLISGEEKNLAGSERTEDFGLLHYVIKRTHDIIRESGMKLSSSQIAILLMIIYSNCLITKGSISPPSDEYIKNQIRYLVKGH